VSDVLNRLKASLADRYAIERELGAGGMAVVYLAEDLKHKRKVALKVLRAELAAAIGSERFVREIEIAAKLSHPHILPLYNSGEAGGILYYVMPYVEGESLRERIDREGKIPVAEMVRLTDEIASALSYAHDQGIVHRDIKPENVMLSGGRAVVADFGIARAVSAAGGTRLTGTGFAVGTPAYMSPEQAFGDTDVDGRSDVYALGCVVYEMAVGRAPFEAETPQALLAKHAADTVPSMRTSDTSIPLFVERAVECALAKQPADRFQTASAFADALTSEMVVAPVGRRRWTRVAVAAPLTIAALTAAVWGYLSFLSGSTYERLAVLPPANLMNDPEQEPLIQGVHEALIWELQRAGIPVKARTSMMRYRNSDTPARDIADELGVDALIEPSLRWGVDSVEVGIGLVDGETEEYIVDPIVASEETGKVISLYRVLVREIVDELQLALSPEARARLASAELVNPAAYQDYLNGRFHWNSLTRAGLETALGYFQQALDKEPGFAQAHAGIAQVWAGRQQFSYSSPTEAGPKAREALARAFAADSTLFEVQYAAALVRTWVNWDWQGGEAAFLKAIDSNPNSADARVYYALLLMMLGRGAECEEQAERAVELDPLNPLILALYGHVLQFLGGLDDAISVYLDALRASPDLPAAHGGLKDAYYKKGMDEEALEKAGMEYALVTGQEITDAMQNAYAEGGPEEAWLLIAEAFAAWAETSYYCPQCIATYFDMAGQVDRAFHWLERAFEARDPELPFSIANLSSEALREDPRYVSLLQRMNLPQ
jgi:serine/threonine-protein kinase